MAVDSMLLCPSTYRDPEVPMVHPGRQDSLAHRVNQVLPDWRDKLGLWDLL